MPRRSYDRRTVIRGGLSAAALAAIPTSLRAAAWSAANALPSPRPHLDAALRAERWIRSARIPTEHGVTWPADPRDPKSASLDLYNGWPGVVLFYLELHHATGDATLLDEARAGGDEILARLATPDAIGGVGLYEGAAGLGFVLDQLHAATRDARYADGARRAFDLVLSRARRVEEGVEWGTTPDGSSTDIISGGAGIGLALLAWHRRTGDQRTLATATQAGRRLIAVALPDEADLKWAMTPTYRRQMPNFSHGTAGVSYFLADLAATTKDPAFLTAAVRGARYLQRIAMCSNDACTVFHHTGDGEQLYYLGWCHGPVGTARLFFRLSQLTAEPSFAAWVGRGARGISSSGIPETRTAGFWNNVGVCCGNAGVADFFLQLHRLHEDRESLAFGERVLADLMRRSTDDAQGLRWVQAENRVSPDVVVAQTGFMQGAAGIGTVLLRFDAFQRRRPVRITWPDSPWPA